MSDLLWGATTAEWDALFQLAGADVRPCVQDPTRSPTATTVLRGDPDKTPSALNHAGQYHGIRGWSRAEYQVGQAEKQNWMSNPAYGAGLVGRNVRAIDIDIDCEDLVDEIVEIIERSMGKLPTRCRHHSPRKMMLFRISDAEGMIKKQVAASPDKKEAVEFLFDRQFFVLAGTHHSGNRMYFPDGIPTSLEDIPEFTLETMNTVIREIREWLGDEDESIAEGKTAALLDSRNISQINPEDHETAHVLASRFFREILPEGIIAVDCPWQHLHASTDGERDEDPSKTVYFPKGLGNRDKSGFKCHHASHGEKTVKQFLETLGYVEEDFVYIGETEESTKTRPNISTSTKGGIPVTVSNIQAFISWKATIGLEYQYDSFFDQLTIREYPDGEFRVLEDNDYHDVTLRLEAQRLYNAPKDRVRAAIISEAMRNQVDGAADWVNSLQWDGVPRLKHFHTKVLGMENTAYHRAVALYWWTAMAGRVLVPGIKADMAVVLTGKQGVGKSRIIRALVPDVTWAGAADLTERDDDLSRATRGKLVVELDELKGLNTRDEDAIKKWVGDDQDTWTPKYVEHAVIKKRRFILIGTTNKTRFLSDPTGNRRWLPVTVCQTQPEIDVGYVETNRDMLWAEAVEIFKKTGIQYAKAEELAREEAPKHTITDAWDAPIKTWLDNIDYDGFPSYAILTQVLALRPGQLNAASTYRLHRILVRMGYELDGDDLWRETLA